MTSPCIELACELINRESITPNDADCQQLISARLSKLGFTLENMPFGDVKNLWATKGESSPCFIFAGHTDVVPPGPESNWSSPPFNASIRDGFLYGRGAADMKGSLAAMIIATENFCKNNPNHKGKIGFLLTSDEEGIAINGTKKVVEALEARNEKIDYCVVGEPSSTEKLGDVIKVGRRGSLHGKLNIIGKQGHIAYPHLAINPIHEAAPAIKTLCETIWDTGYENFPPTSFQIHTYNSTTGADNVIPGQAHIEFNFRYSPASTAEQLQERVETILKDHNVPHEINWRVSGKPFMTPKGKLLQATEKAIFDKLGLKTSPSTSGGTSDGRFIAEMECELLEFGPCNRTIHQVDECVKCDDLENLAKTYEELLAQLLL